MVLVKFVAQGDEHGRVPTQHALLRFVAALDGEPVRAKGALPPVERAVADVERALSVLRAHVAEVDARVLGRFVASTRATLDRLEDDWEGSCSVALAS
jgi:hypothetical protein